MLEHQPLKLKKKTGLTRQTVSKTIKYMEKNKEIWGYTAIFDPKLVEKKPFIFIAKADFSINTEDFIKKITNSKLIKENDEKYGYVTAMLTHGDSDMIGIVWAKDIIEAKKIMNYYKNVLHPNLKEQVLLDVITTFRNNGIENPKMVEEWTNLLL